MQDGPTSPVTGVTAGGGHAELKVPHVVRDQPGGGFHPGPATAFPHLHSLDPRVGLSWGSCDK